MGKRQGAPKTANKIRGLKAQRAGKAFEQAFETICAQNNFTCIRIPDSCRRIPYRPFIIRIKSPFDFVISYQHTFHAFLDLKSTTQNAFSHSMLDQTQVSTLINARHNSLAGYLVYFTTLNIITFFDAKTLKALSPRESLTPQDGTILGNLGYSCDLHLLKALPLKILCDTSITP